MKSKIITTIVLLFISGAIIWRWMSVTTGAVVAESTRDKGQIKIRFVSTGTSTLGSLLGASTGYYRCEYYITVPQTRMFSALSYREDSYIANSIKIEWDDKGGAKIYFDGTPTMKIENNTWSQISPGR